jgi:hypothetical protein
MDIEAIYDAIDSAIGDPGEAEVEILIRLGRQLHEFGGLSAMIDAAQQVASRDQNDYGRRISLLDRAWDGVGEWLS